VIRVDETSAVSFPPKVIGRRLRPLVICGLDLREPLHAGGVDLGDPVLVACTVYAFGDLAIPECSSRVIGEIA